jgi:PAS domain S-box-containing protein
MTDERGPTVADSAAGHASAADRSPLLDPRAALEHLLHARELAVREQTERLAVALSEIREYARQLERSEEELRRQTHILHLVLDSIADGVVIADEEGTLRHLNRAAEAILGARLVEAPVERWSAHYGCYLPDTVTPYPPEELPLARAIRGETVQEVEVFIRNAGRPAGLWLSINAAPLRDSDGTARGGVAAFRDVTAHKQAELRLAVQYAVTRILAECETVAAAVPRLLATIGALKGWPAGAFWAVDEERRVLHCLDFWQAPGTGAAQLQAASRRAAFAPGVGLPGRVWQSGDAVWVADVRREDNCPRAAEALACGLLSGYAAPVHSQGKVLGVLEFFNRAGHALEDDLRPLLAALASQVGQFLQRKRSEDALRQSHALLQSIAEGTTDAVFVKDLRGRYLMINSAGARFLGKSVEAVLGKDDTELFSPETARVIMEGDRRVLEAGQPLTYEDVGTAAGVTRTFLSTKGPYRDAQGNAVGVLGISRDISERKRAEEDLQRTAAELARSNEDLQQFAYVVSHDLQEPLRMVSGFCGLLQRRYQGRLGPDADEFIAFAVDGAARMEKLINELLTYARVNTRGHAFAPADAGVVFEQAVANLAAAIQEAGAVITRDALPVVQGDETQLGQLAQNLLANAVKFRGREPPRVHVSAERHGAGWRFAVRDNGIGIDAADLKRVFGIFERLHPTSEYPGTGIGLAICKRIVDRHGGRIWAESALGQGSVFYFTLPDREEPFSTGP